MDPMLTILMQIGLGVATNAVYDFIRRKFSESKDINVEEFKRELQDAIILAGVSIKAETVIDVLAKKGFIQITNSKLHASRELIFGSVAGEAIAGNNTKLSTDRTAIEAGLGAFVKTQGNAQIRQNPDGSISFHVGERNNSISIHTNKVV